MAVASPALLLNVWQLQHSSSMAATARTCVQRFLSVCVVSRELFGVVLCHLELSSPSFSVVSWVGGSDLKLSGLTVVLQARGLEGQSTDSQDPEQVYVGTTNTRRNKQRFPSKTVSKCPTSSEFAFEIHYSICRDKTY